MSDEIPQVDQFAWPKSISALMEHASESGNPVLWEPIIELANQLQHNTALFDFEPSAYEATIYLTPIKNQWPRVAVNYNEDSMWFTVWLWDYTHDAFNVQNTAFRCLEDTVESEVARYCGMARDELQYRKFRSEVAKKKSRPKKAATK